MRYAILLTLLCGGAWGQSGISPATPPKGMSAIYRESNGDYGCSINGATFHKCTDADFKRLGVVLNMPPALAAQPAQKPATSGTGTIKRQKIPTTWLSDSPAPSLSCAPECKLTIKTKRWKNGKTIECAYAGYNGHADCRTVPTPTYCPTGYSCQDTEDASHELYLGNQLIGTLESK